MTIRSNSFYLKQKIEVIVDLDNQMLRGTLHFGGSKEIPKFRVKDKSSPVLSVFFTYVCDNTELTCTSLHNDITYTLHGIKLNELVVSALLQRS